MTMSQETRRKISESMKGRKKPPLSEEHKRKFLSHSRSVLQYLSRRERKYRKLLWDMLFRQKRLVRLAPPIEENPKSIVSQGVAAASTLEVKAPMSLSTDIGS